MSTTDIMCRTCQANPPAVNDRCLPCHADAQREAWARELAQEQQRLANSRRGRPAWKPGTSQARGHGLGSPYLEGRK
jgi:hypothetical protein